MISEEKYPTYNRPMLTKALNAGLEISQIQVEPESWYEENQVYQILGKKIISVDKTEKEVTLEDGTGSKKLRPSDPGKRKRAGGSDPYSGRCRKNRADDPKERTDSRDRRWCAWT